MLRGSLKLLTPLLDINLEVSIDDAMALTDQIRAQKQHLEAFGATETFLR